MVCLFQYPVLLAWVPLCKVRPDGQGGSRNPSLGSINLLGKLTEIVYLLDWFTLKEYNAGTA